MTGTADAESSADFETEIDRFAGDVFTRMLHAAETLTIYVGDRLGLYRVLADRGPLTVEGLAEASGMHPRYAREWLEQQAVAGILTVDGDQFVLPAAHAVVLADASSTAYAAPSARIAAAAASRLPELLDAYRTGGGVGWDAFGDDARDAQGDMNRPWFETRLAAALASVPAVHDVLSGPGARIVDVACGHGWSTQALARAYPSATVRGVDVDGPSIDSAREHAAGAASVSFEQASAETLAGPFDAAFVFEALHDMPHPVTVLRALHDAVADDGVVVVMDEAVADAFAPDGDEVERIMYAWSLLVCLPDGMSTPDSAATGTVMRPSTLERYAREAGFAGIEVLPIEGFGAFRFYRLVRDTHG